MNQSLTSPPPLQVTFNAGHTGPWRITSITAVTGETLPIAPRLQVIEAPECSPPIAALWSLRGTTSNLRYTTAAEAAALRAIQAPLGRLEATCAALIPIRKNPAWWALAQDQRRDLLEEQSHHIAIGIESLPPIARRLHHSRELAEPFDFLTWFEFAPRHITHFDHLLARLRRTPEWAFVEREVDIRLTRTSL